MDGVGSPPDQPSEAFFTPLLISMAGIGSTSLAIVAYHFFVVRYCLRRGLRSSGTDSGTQTLHNPQFANGVEEKILITIPILSYSTEDHDHDHDTNLFRVDQTECVVCLGELEDGDMVRLLPNCRHAFHVPCIDNWFQGHSSCPICRSPVAEPSCSSTPDVALPVNDDNTNDVIQTLPDHHHFHGQDGGCLLTSACDVSASSSGVVRVESTCLIRHSVSTVLPMEVKPQRWAAALKRSLSMDQYYVLVNLQSDYKKEESSSSLSSSSSRNVLILESRSYRARSMRHLDRMSSRLMRSFSQLRMGRCSSTANEILPY